MGRTVRGARQSATRGSGMPLRDRSAAFVRADVRDSAPAVELEFVQEFRMVEWLAD